ncbi:hypothetical protein ACLB2K_041546 [Fragaria x ananassa]
MHSDIKKYVAECEICQQHHNENVKPLGLLQPLAIPDKAWEDIAMDFIDALPKSEGKTTIWVVIDKFTKYAHFIPLSHPYTAASLAQVFIKEIFRLHGLPLNITSDRDPIFMSLFLGGIFSTAGNQTQQVFGIPPPK